MPKSAFTENRTEAARTFVDHLRRHPADARHDPAALAARFGLETEFVRRALARLPEPLRAEAPRRPSQIAERAGGLVALLDDAVERASHSPVRFEALSLLVAVGASVALFVTLPGSSYRAGAAQVSLRGVAILLTLFATVAVQMAVFYRRRMARYAVYGGLVFWLGTALPAMFAIWLALRGKPEFGRGVQVFTVGLGMAFVGATYAGLAALASLAGGWVHLKRADREWERLSRQELLERYFELQRRLERSDAAPDVEQGWETWRAVAAVRRHPAASAAALGAAVTLVQIALGLAFGARPGVDPKSDAFDLLSGVHALDAYVLFSMVAFLSGRATRGGVVAAAYAAGAFSVTLIPLATYGPAYALALPNLLAAILGLGFLLVLGALSGAGATIQRRAAREVRLQRNDGATLVAEMLEIQWRLEEDATSVTVLVVDAAKSTAMKVGADPLDVEYSFREYQMWIAEICAGFGGRIHSVAGDGAVVAFSDGAAAMGAARRIQTDVARFNAAANRLPKPFRLRLGLHAGRVAGDLNDVQFTEVIDIAAHVEDIAPVGGVAATGAVVSAIGEEGFLPLARDVDGQAVFIALVPTEA